MTDIVVVLDIDLSLLCAVFDHDKLTLIEQNMNLPGMKEKIVRGTLIDGNDTLMRGTGTLEKFALIKRPHLKEFIEYLSSKIDNIHIWSAGHFRYVRAIEDVIFPNDMILNRLTRKDTYIDDVKVLKDLNLKGFDLAKTIAIDDRDDTFSLNPHNAIHVPPYEPDCSVRSLVEDDQTLLKIIDWFENSGVLTCKDVRTIPKPYLL